jgi:hypothetical protein
MLAYEYLLIIAWKTGAGMRAADPESPTGRWRPLTAVLYRLGREHWEFWSCVPAPIATSDGRLGFLLRRAVSGAETTGSDPASPAA